MFWVHLQNCTFCICMRAAVHQDQMLTAADASAGVKHDPSNVCYVA